ncbi:hypothetical protein KVR01_008584 [Diaporthe batatas]|uniref:uncharacterized protein n=1 Tax=Diaporthe batatas TaxID=748121 RepID=UPI001D059A00|nr:uncharacterized protein KVR01_008584 [Diaporthe batatas]KAG8161597.1 hypothetical protein KVR01_008584 [Diaporthe batatas]
MMEVVAEEQGPLEADKEFGLEDTRDDEFDFDIDGPVAGLESTDDVVAYDTETNDALPDARTYSTQDHVAQQVLHESYDGQIAGQEQGQHDIEVSAFETSIDAAVVVQVDQFGDEEGGNAELEEPQQATEAQYGEGDRYQEDDYVEVTAEEVRDLVDADQHNEGQDQDATVATGHAEFSHPEDEHFHDDLHEEGISAEQIGPGQSGDEAPPPVDSSYADEATENGMVAEPHSEEALQSASLGDDSSLAETAVHQNNADTAHGLDDVSSQEDELLEGSEQHPRVRVSYGTAEFYLFAESPNADPDDYFFENADVLSQPLSDFLTKVRQVITEDLQDLDELYVKVDGLGVEFGETTTNDFLERTTFGQILELYDQLVKLDDDSSEVPELYIYLETRPNCLRRLTELSNNASNGKGLSEVGFYYEGTPDLTAIEEASNEYDGAHQGADSDDISDNESNDQVEGGLGETHEAGQSSNPFRLSESQQQAMDISNSRLAEEEAADDPMAADHPAYEDENDEALLNEVQADLELAGPPAPPDVSATEAQQDSDLLPGEDEDLAADVANDGIDDDQYAEEGAQLGDEATGTEANAEAENEDLQDDDGPTDDYDTAEHDDYLDIEATEEQPTEPAGYAASAGTPEPTSHNSSATATLDGEGPGHGDDTSAADALIDAGRSFETPLQAEPDPPETETDEIHWNDDDEAEHDNDGDEVDITNQNQTDLSPSSLSIKRGRQADEDDVGPGDDSIAKRRRT